MNENKEILCLLISNTLQALVSNCTSYHKLKLLRLQNMVGNNYYEATEQIREELKLEENDEDSGSQS